MECDQHVIDVAIEVPAKEVLRLMGCAPGAPVRPNLRDLIDRLLGESRSLLRPRGVYTVCDVERMTDTELALRGCRPIIGPIAGFLRPARRVAAFVVTLGHEIEALAAERLHRGEMLEGYTLNAIGSAAADIAADAMADSIYWREAGPDEGITPPFSPGYCGLPLEEQQTLFSIVDGGAIGVKLSPTMIMEPIKSVSGLVGIGDAQEIMDRGVPCQRCQLNECRMRRE
jgi:hypothetical protein